MDIKEIKRQIEYWEAIEKDNAQRIKGIEANQRMVRETLKYLRAMLPKEKKADVVEDRTEETSENLQQ